MSLGKSARSYYIFLVSTVNVYCLSDQITESPLEKYVEDVCKRFGELRKNEASSA